MPSPLCVQVSALSSQRLVMFTISISPSTILRHYGPGRDSHLRSSLREEPVTQVCSILSRNQELRAFRLLRRATLLVTKSVKYRGLDLRRDAKFQRWRRMLSFRTLQVTQASTSHFIAQRMVNMMLPISGLWTTMSITSPILIRHLPRFNTLKLRRCFLMLRIVYLRAEN